MGTDGPTPLTRRAALAGAAGAALALSLRPAAATPASMQAAIQAFTGGAPVAQGGVTLEMPAIVENGNAVPLTVRVDSPMTAQDHVQAIAVFNERNPQPNVAVFHFTPRSGRAQASTRIRLGDTQRVVAVARLSDGRFLSASAELVVTLPACIEEQS